MSVSWSAAFESRRVYRGEFGDVFVRGAERRQPDLLRELGEIGIEKERHVSEYLVAAVTVRRQTDRQHRKVRCFNCIYSTVVIVPSMSTTDVWRGIT